MYQGLRPFYICSPKPRVVSSILTAPARKRQIPKGICLFNYVCLTANCVTWLMMSATPNDVDFA